MYNEKINLKLYTFENNTFVMQAIIDNYEEISFTDSLYEAGDFTISINYNIPNSQKFKRGMFVQFGDVPYRFGEILTITDSIGSDGKGSQLRVITGKDARYIFKRRVIKNLNDTENWTMTAKGEICLRELIKAQCGAGAEQKRQLPIVNTIPASADAIGDEYSVSESFSNLYDSLVTIATQSKVGWRIHFKDGVMTLECYTGTDRSTTVQFSTDFDSLADGTFSDSAESYANSIYIGGKGQGADRDLYEGEQEIEGDSPSGLDRYEAYDNQSQMTTEAEYEAEALSMLTQYGQTIELSGNGLAKSPYVYMNQYYIGDTITVAFSGKSAIVQLLSVTENWSGRGEYGISFEFGKPQNNFDRQMQLILNQIQKASVKTSSTDSVRWYTVRTDTEMPKGDVVYTHIGFVGNVLSGATFKLYLDNEKTGSKTYHVRMKQVSGIGKLTLTTGKTGATDLQLPSGTYVAIIYVDENGNITMAGSTATNTVESGNIFPVTSEGVYQAIQSSALTVVDTVQSGNLNPVTSNAVANALSTRLDYVYDEVDTGMKWVNGKPIYRKVFNLSANLVNVSTSLLQNMNIDNLLRNDLQVWNSNQMYWVSNGIFYNTSTKKISFNSTYQQVYVYFYIIEYTKSTDSPTRNIEETRKISDDEPIEEPKEEEKK